MVSRLWVYYSRPMTGATLPKRSFSKIVAEITRILLAVILAALFVIILSAVLVGGEVLCLLNRSDSYITLANQTHLTVRLRGLIASTLINSISKNTPQFMVVDLQKYPPQTWDNIAAVLLPTDWLDSNYNHIVQTLLVWLNSDNSALPTFSLDLSPLKKILLSSKGWMQFKRMMILKKRFLKQIKQGLLLLTRIIRSRKESWQKQRRLRQLPARPETP